MGARRVPEQPDSDRPHRPDGAEVRAVLPAAQRHRAGGKRSVAQQLRLRTEPGVRHLPQHRHQGRPERERQDETVRPLRVQQADRTAQHERDLVRPRAGWSAAALAHQPHRCRRLDSNGELVAGRQRPRRSQSVPGARALRSRAELQSRRSGLPVVVRQPASEQSLSSAELCDDRVRPQRLRGEHDRDDGVPESRPQQPQQRNHDRCQPAAELLVGEGHAQRARRPRHAADVVHARDQHQPVRVDLRPPIYAAGLQCVGGAERQFDRIVPARRTRLRRDREQLLPDVPLELLRAVGSGRLEGHEPVDGERRRALGLQHSGLREGRPNQLRLR